MSTVSSCAHSFQEAVERIKRDEPNLESVSSNLKLLTQSVKTMKSDNHQSDYLMKIMYFAPASVAGFNVCPSASDGCRAGCLWTAGHGAYQSAQNAKIMRTLLWRYERDQFFEQLNREIANFQTHCERNGRQAVVRLNGTSDLPFERWRIFRKHRGVQFLDYTKRVNRMLKFCDGMMDGNYHLTFSRSESNESDCLEILERGGTVSAVFHRRIPKRWKGYRVINGDVSDLRFLDKPSTVVGLIAKGSARRDESGFVIRN